MSSTTAIDSHDVRALRVASLRARFLRILLVAGAGVLLALAAWSTRGSSSGTAGLLPGSDGMVVIDLSLSIGGEDYADMRRTLRRLIDDDASLGLVTFSDVGYELLPPGTPASELRPMLRFLVAPKSGSPVTPWSGSFRAGTRISSALELARDALVRDGVQGGSILLLSDLITAPEDVPQLARVLHQLQRQGVDMRVVPLTPLRAGRRLFEGLLGKSALIKPNEIGDRQSVWSETHVGLPAAFLLFSGLLFAVLAAHERFAGRLGLPRVQKSHA